MKFGVPLQILVLRTVTWQSIKKISNSKRRTTAILKIVFGYIWTNYCPINAKFDMKKQNYIQIQVTWPKYHQSLKISDGGRPPFWKWFHHYISAADHPISMKFGVPLHNLVPRTVTLKYQNFTNSKCRTAALFVSDTRRLYVGLQIWWVLWVNRRSPPMLIVIQG